MPIFHLAFSIFFCIVATRFSKTCSSSSSLVISEDSSLAVQLYLFFILAAPTKLVETCRVAWLFCQWSILSFRFLPGISQAFIQLPLSRTTCPSEFFWHKPFWIYSAAFGQLLRKWLLSEQKMHRWCGLSLGRSGPPVVCCLSKMAILLATSLAMAFIFKLSYPCERLKVSFLTVISLSFGDVSVGLHKSTNRAARDFRQRIWVI